MAIAAAGIGLLAFFMTQELAFLWLMMGTYLLLVVLPWVPQFPVVFLVKAALFVALALDPPSGRPFYEIELWTESLGGLFFESLPKVTGLPLPLTLFEVMSFTIAFLCLRASAHATSSLSSGDAPHSPFDLGCDDWIRGSRGFLAFS